RFVYLDPNVAFPAELRDRRIRIRYRLAVGVVLILDLRGTLALHGACDDRGGLFVTGSGEQRLVDLLDVVTVDLDHVPAESPDPFGVRRGVPTVPGQIGRASCRERV